MATTQGLRTDIQNEAQLSQTINQRTEQVNNANDCPSAKTAFAFAQSDLQSAENQLANAKNEVGLAKTDVDTANTDKQEADKQKTEDDGKLPPLQKKLENLSNQLAIDQQLASGQTTLPGQSSQADFQQQVQQNITKLQGLIADVQGQIALVQAQMNLDDENVQKAQKEVEDTTTILKGYTQLITDLTNDLATAQKNVDTANKIVIHYCTAKQTIAPGVFYNVAGQIVHEDQGTGLMIPPGSNISPGTPLQPPETPTPSNPPPVLISLGTAAVSGGNPPDTIVTFSGGNPIATGSTDASGTFAGPQSIPLSAFAPPQLEPPNSTSFGLPSSFVQQNNISTPFTVVGNPFSNNNGIIVTTNGGGDLGGASITNNDIGSLGDGLPQG